MFDKKSISMLGLRSLRYFVTVAEELHFGRAAERAGVAQPAISLQIRSLEERLGVGLFDRRGREVMLTPAGEVLLTHARKLLAGADMAVAETRRAGRGLVGHLTIGFVHSLAYVALPPILSRFRREYPNVALTLQELTVIQQRDAILSGEVDVGIVRSPINHQSVRMDVLGSETFVVAVPSPHRLATRARVRAADLADEPFIMFPDTAGDVGVHGLLMHWLAKHRITPQIAQEAKTLHTGIAVVRAGLGIAVVPASTRVAQIDGVTYVDLVGAPTITTAIACRHGNNSPLMQSFCDLTKRVRIVA